MLQLIQFFLSKQWEVFFGTTSTKNNNSINLLELGIKEVLIELNSHTFDELIKEMNPTMVLFDRFMTEEQFGWRVSESCPNAIRILDTEDLHCLRKTREQAIKKEVEFSTNQFLNSETAKREIASILRCDVSLIISTFEMDLLKKVFKIDEKILFYLPFLLDKVDENTIKKWNSFEERQHFVFIGNFYHKPNLDATIKLKKTIWPLIRKKISEAQLYIYGAYPTQQIMQFHDPKEGFFVHGFKENINYVLQKTKVFLAPLSFGAGLKGKFIDAMQNGCPSITTQIGIEGYSDSKKWCGLVSENWNDFVTKSVELYTNKTLWAKSQQNGFEILNQFDKDKFYQVLTKKIKSIQSNLSEHRNQNFLGNLLQFHTLQATKYMSKWIEEKNKTS